MKNYTILLALLFVLASCANRGNDRNQATDWENANLYRNVQTVTEFRVDAPGPDLEESGTSDMTDRRTYNAYGKLLEQEAFDAYGEPVSKSTYRYDEKQRLTEVCFDYFEENNIIRQTNKYDENDHVVYSNAYQNDVLLQEIFFEYDQNGALQKATLLDDADTMVAYHHEETEVLETGESVKTKRAWDENDPETVTSQVYKYDKHGNLIQELLIDNYLWNMKTERTYDKKNRLTKEVSYQNNEITTEVFYDVYRNPVLVKYYEKGELKSEVKNIYAFDKYHNWIKKEVSIKDKNAEDFMPYFVEKREITYYK